MELEVGMYVRTKFGISKIIEDGYVKVIISDGEETRDVDKNGRHYPTQFRDYIWTSDVIKANHNIIDLIEVGDVIIDNKGHKYPINYDFEIDYNNEYGSYEITIDDNITLFFKDGLSIVTKEQFESMAYKVSE